MFYGIKHVAFEKFIAELFRTIGYGVKEEQIYGNGCADIVLFNNDIMEYICEIKYCSNIDLSSYSLKKALFQFQKYSVYNSKKMLIINSVCDKEIKEQILEDTGVLVFDLCNILYYIDVNSILYKDLLGILEFSINGVDSEKPIVDLLNKVNGVNDLNEIDWKNKFNTIESGKEKFSEYENLCIDALKLVLSDSLAIWEKQSKSTGDLFRFDLICKIKKSIEDDFFTTLNKHFNTKYIIFEFKNYKEKISQREIYTTEKYLYDKALRNVAIIVSRNGIDKNADTAIKGSLREQGKLIISLTDSDLLEMIDMYYKGENAADYLGSKLDKLLIELEK